MFPIDLFYKLLHKFHYTHPFLKHIVLCQLLSENCDTKSKWNHPRPGVLLNQIWCWLTSNDYPLIKLQQIYSTNELFYYFKMFRLILSFLITERQIVWTGRCWRNPPYLIPSWISHNFGKFMKKVIKFWILHRSKYVNELQMILPRAHKYSESQLH